LASGLDVLKASPISVYAAVNDAAAKTVTSPDTVGAADVVGASVVGAGVVATGADAADVLDELEFSSPQEAATNPTVATAASKHL
jgi:hypothetical protein